MWGRKGENDYCIEAQNGDAYTALTGKETAIANGIYRLAYNLENGENKQNGYRRL